MLTSRRHRGLGGVAPFYPVDIPYSCRFDSARSCYLSRTPGADGDRRKGTLFFSMKADAPNGSQNPILMSYVDASNYTWVYLDGSGYLVIKFVAGGVVATMYSAGLLRDPSNHYHVMIAWDTTQATDTNRVKLYINGVQSAFLATPSFPAQNADLSVVRSGVAFNIGWDTGSAYFRGYLSEFNYVDGAQLAVSSIYQAAIGNPNVCVLKPFSVTYGAKGFRLQFGNAAALGTDTSGNGNNYTSSGLASTDQMADTPTNNACVLNALTGSGALSEGNLKMATGERFGTFGLSSGKWSWKFASTSTQANGIEKADGTESTVAGVNGKTDEFLLDLGAGTLDYVRDGSTTSIATGLSGTFFPLFKAAGTAQFTGYTPATGYKLITADNFTTPPAIVTSGTFTGNANADGPFVYTGGTPDSLSIDSNAVTWGTHADKLANGFKIRTAAAGYNDAAANNWTAVTTLDRRFPLNNAQGNP